MERTKENKTPLREQGQEWVSGRIFPALPLCRVNLFAILLSFLFFVFCCFGSSQGAAKQPNLSALRQIITQYKVTQSITLLGQGFHPLDT